MQGKVYPDVPPDFGNWLAGFIDGEGCFSTLSISRPGRTTPCWACRFTLRLRSDDLGIIQEIREQTGLGSIVQYRVSRKQAWDSKPVSLWHVFTKCDCLRLIDLLDRFPLRAKKARDYAIWRETVFVWRTVLRGNITQVTRNADAWARMEVLAQQLKDVRAYAPHLLEVGKMDAVPSLDDLVGGEGVAPAQMILVEPGQRQDVVDGVSALWGESIPDIDVMDPE